MDLLISASELATQLDFADQVILDATFFLPGQGRSASDEYLAEHIPGSHFFDIDRIADQESDLPHMLPTAEAFAEAVGKLGISNNTQVVIYDNNVFMASARVWWMFKIFGHTRIKVLDGGLHHWKQSGYRVESGAPPIGEGSYKAHFNPALVKTFDEVKAAVETGTSKIVDARPAGRFKGIEAEPRAGLRSGHIPGSANVFFKTLLDEKTHRLRQPDEILAIFTAQSIVPGESLILSCGSGVTAAILSLALATIEYPDSPIYDGSWSEWGRPGHHPVETD